MPPSAAPTSEKRLPSLDGWRAISILLVLGSHSAVAAQFPQSLLTHKLDTVWGLAGPFGVRVFFIISGFLITWLLLQEETRTGTVSLRNFYVRRAIRILPVCAVYLLVIAVLQFEGLYTQPLPTWIGNLTFTSNFIIKGAWQTGHLWSLGVEEQFYLFWPIALVAGGLILRPRAAMLVCIASLLIAPMWRVCTYTHAIQGPLGVLFCHWSFFNFFDALASGCLGAFLFARSDLLARWCTWRPGWTAGIAVIAMTVPNLLLLNFAWAWFTVPFAPTAMNLGILFLLLQSIHFHDRWPFAWLNQPLVVKVGVLSYSLYIWQQLFCGPVYVFSAHPGWWNFFPFCIGAAFVVALISYYGFELPLVRLRARYR